MDVGPQCPYWGCWASGLLSLPVNHVSIVTHFTTAQNNCSHGWQDPKLPGGKVQGHPSSRVGLAVEQAGQGWVPSGLLTLASLWGCPCASQPVPLLSPREP